MSTYSRLRIFFRSCSGSGHIPSAANKDGSLAVAAGTVGGIEGPVGVELVVAMIGAAGIAVAGGRGIAVAGRDGMAVAGGSGMAVAGGGGVAVVGRGSSVGVVVGWVVISGMCASAELPGVTPMAAVTAVVVVGMVGGWFCCVCIGI